MSKSIMFRHVHICPICQVKRDCDNAVPYLECREAEECEEHRQEQAVHEEN